MRAIAPVLLTLLALSVCADGDAQPVPGPGVRARAYDPATVETVAGVVTSVTRGGGGKAGGGIHLALRTDAGGTMSVRLGPASYVDRQSMKIAEGDRVEVKGSRIGSGSETAIIAAEVRKGHETLRLRNDAGIPAWSGGGRRR